MWTQESESVYWLKIVYWRNLENVYSFSVEIYSERDGSGFPLAAVTEIDSAVTIRYLGGVVSIPECRQMASVLKYAAAIAANIGAYKELLREGEKPAGKQGDLALASGNPQPIEIVAMCLRLASEAGCLTTGEVKSFLRRKHPDLFQAAYRQAKRDRSL